LIGVHWTISLCASATAVFPISKDTDAILRKNKASPDIGREKTPLELTASQLAETFGNMTTLRATHSAAMDRWGLPSRGQTPPAKLHSAWPRVYDKIITSCASAEVLKSKHPSC
jgi:hypothetical protein